MTLLSLVAVLTVAAVGVVGCVTYAAGIVLWLVRDARRRARADVARAADRRVWSVHRGGGRVESWELRS